jgi:hypothetical protein
VNRFVSKRSCFFGILAWACIVALGADFANIDDLIDTGTVLHDDQDVLAGQFQNLSNTSHSPAGITAYAPGPQVRTSVDQDSPSLEAEIDASEIAVMNLPSEPDASIEFTLHPDEALYLKYRNLLI